MAFCLVCGLFFFQLMDQPGNTAVWIVFVPLTKGASTKENILMRSVQRAGKCSIRNGNAIGKIITAAKSAPDRLRQRKRVRCAGIFLE